MPNVNVHLSLRSSNTKTGPIPVSTTSSESCPSTCPLKGTGCYAESGKLALHWQDVTRGGRGGSWDAFLAAVRKFKPAQLWRHNQAGDLPQDGEGVIDREAVLALADANEGRRGFTYTHHDMSLPGNAETVREANARGFAISLSANGPEHADDLAGLDIAPVVTVISEYAPAVTFTPSGRRIVTCPAVQREGVNCLQCKLCANPDRKVIIGFPLHGARRRTAARELGI